MKRTNTLIAFFRLAIVAGLALAACQPAAQQAAAPESALDRIQSAGVMKACIAPEFPPDMYLDDQGNPAGFSVDLTQAMADSLGVKVEWVQSDFAGIIAGVGSGKCDIAPGTVAPRAKRALVGSFAKVILLSIVGLVVDANDTRTTIDDFNKPDVTFAVLEGTLSEAVYDRDFSNAQVTKFSDVNAGFLEVLSGRAQAYPMDDVTGRAYAAQQPALKMILTGSGGLGVSPTAPLVPLGDDKFIRWIDTFVDEYINNGDYAVLFKKDMGYDPDIPTLMAWR
jgi:ABC-type amino acid transport substrate-binding protein